jgi:hypothetical protein
MGREATCQVKWGPEEGLCKVQLEGDELIVRLGMRRRVPLSSLVNLAVVGDNLVFRVGKDRIELHLGSAVAERWAKAIETPGPTLAKKLGISSTTKLQVIGAVQSEELKRAIAEAGTVVEKKADLVVVCVNSKSEIDQYLKKKTFICPLWVVYPKGPLSEAKESEVRDLLRSRGFIDTKVASVSAKLTALRFVKPKAKN